MMPWTSILGLAACAFVAGAALLAVLPISSRPPAVRIGAAAAIAGIMLIPIDGLIVAGYVRGVIGDPSITTLLIMACIATRRLTGRELFGDRNLAATMGLVLLGGAYLYPMAMGLGPYDPYALGFGSWWMYGGLLVIVLVAWRRHLYLPLACIVLAMAAFTLGLFESTNLWNDLIDPIAVVLAAGWLIERAVTFARRRREEPEEKAAAA